MFIFCRHPAHEQAWLAFNVTFTQQENDPSTQKQLEVEVHVLRQVTIVSHIEGFVQTSVGSTWSSATPHDVRG